jgi:putative membrane protein
MMWNGFGWMWMLGPLMMVVFWGGIIVLAVWAVRALSGGPGSGQDSALDILRRRLASGEITRDEYDQARKALQG